MAARCLRVRENNLLVARLLSGGQDTTSSFNAFRDVSSSGRRICEGGCRNRGSEMSNHMMAFAGRLAGLVRPAR